MRRRRRREVVLAGTAAVAIALLALPTLAVAWAFQGAPGVYGAAAGLVLVLVLFGAAGLVQVWAARLEPATALAVLLGGVGVRLVLYLAALQGLARVEHLHRPSLAIATAVAFVLTLGLEMHQVSRSPELFWLQGRSDRASEGVAR